VTAEQVRRWKEKHPDAIVVAYINTTAEVKAEVDYCCTSANAVKVIQSLPPDRDILFLPDMFLGLYVQRKTGRRMYLWPGECHVHAGFRSEEVAELLERYPDADLLLHPECGCISQCMLALAEGELPEDRTFVYSTSGMVRHAKESPRKTHLVATEVDILHRMKKEAPQKRFISVREDAICEYMKTITCPRCIAACGTWFTRSPSHPTSPSAPAKPLSGCWKSCDFNPLRPVAKGVSPPLKGKEGE